MLYFWLSTAFALIALILATFALARDRLKVRYVVQQYHDIDARLDTIEGRVKKLNANYALLLARERLHNTDELADNEDLAQRPGESSEQWKKRARDLIRSGKVKVGGTA